MTISKAEGTIVMFFVGLSLAGCGVLPTQPRTNLDARADHFRSLGLVCADPRLDPGYASLGATQIDCRGAVSGVQIVVTVDEDSQGAPLVSASVAQASGRRAAVEAWSAVVLPMPGLELVQVEVAAGLEDWASGGSASIPVPGGLAWVATGEAGEWTFSVDPDAAPR